MALYQGSPTVTTQTVATLHAIEGKPVFPCWPNKRPATKEGFKGASIDPQQVSKWFEDETMLIGVPTAGFLVVDLDRHNEEANGVEVWGNLVTEHDPDGNWKKTMIVRTPSGGVHVWFEDPGWPDNPHRNTAGKLGPGVDTRADGGYVIIPPSITEEGMYVRIDDWNGNEIAPAPGWLLKLLAPEPKQPQSPSKSFSGNWVGSTSGYGAAALRNEIKALSQAPKGTRNHALNRATFALAQLVAGKVLDEGKVIEALTETALGIGLEEEEIEITIRSGMQAGLQQPRGVPEINDG